MIRTLYDNKKLSFTGENLYRIKQKTIMFLIGFAVKNNVRLSLLLGVTVDIRIKPAYIKARFKIKQASTGVVVLPLSIKP